MYKIIGGDGKEYGPVSAEQLRQWMTEGRVNAQTRAQAEGSTTWQPLGEFPEFAVPPTTGAVPPSATPPPPPAPGQPRPQISNYLVPAILSTICCCLPFGVVAIIFAAQVNTKLQAGDIPGAMEASKKAKMWCWLSLVFGIIAQLLLVPMMRFSMMRAHRGW